MHALTALFREPLVQAVLALLALLGGALVTIRKQHWFRRPRRGSSGGAFLLAGLVILASEWPLLRHLPSFFRAPALMPGGDAISHSTVAHQLATSGSAWIDRYDGGFPAFLHYPPLAWSLTAMTEWVGVAPVAAANVVGFAPLVLVPFVPLVVARRARAHVVSGLAGALFLSTYAPWSAYFGGIEAYMGTGLLSQALAWLLVPLLVWSVVFERNAWFPVVMGAAMALGHPQVAIPSFVALGVGAFVLANRYVVRSFVRSGVAAFVVGAATYGPGLRAMDIPFGWPANLQGNDPRQVGYAPAKLASWFVEGVLFDVDRAPIATVVFVGSVLVAIVFVKRAASRAALAAIVATLLYAAIGHSLAHFGAVGRALLTFLQPLRVCVVVPFVVCAAIAVAVDRLARARVPAEARWAGRSIAVVSVAGVFIYAIPSRAHAVDGMMAMLQPGHCAPSIVARIAEGHPGRLSDQEKDASCFWREGEGWRRRGPFGASGGVGAHVGVLFHAFTSLAPEKPGAATRAEALGVRRVVTTAERPSESDRAAWRSLADEDGARVWERVGGTDLVGVGCVARRWTGTNAELRSRVIAELQSGRGDPLLDPRVLVELRVAQARPFSDDALDPAGCDASTTRVTEDDAPAAGHYGARIDGDHPVDVVFRATHSPTWHVTLDGGEASFRRVAPGFFSTRVPAGSHRVEAAARLPRGYVAGVAAALGLCFLLARGRSRRHRRFAR